MNRRTLASLLGAAENETLPGKRRILNEARAALAAPWLDAKLRSALSKLADECGEPWSLPTIAPLAIGESYLLLVGATATGGDAVRARVIQANYAKHPQAQPEVDAAIAAMAAAATIEQKMLPGAWYGSALEVLGDSTLDIAGGSLGLCTAVALLSAATQRAANSKVAGSAALNASGELVPIKFLDQKCEALRERWPEVEVVVVAAAQETVPSIAGLRFERAANLAQAVAHFGLSFDQLTLVKKADLETRLTQLRGEEERHQKSAQWLSLSQEAWDLGKHLKRLKSAEWAEAKLLAGIMASHAGATRLAIEKLQSVADEELRSKALKANRLINLASCLIEADRPRAIGLAAQSVELADTLEAHDQDNLLGRAHGTYGRALMHDGRFTEAEPHLRAGYDHHSRETPAQEARSGCYLACCLRLVGRHEEALAMAQARWADAALRKEHDDTAASSMAYAALETGRALLALGRAEEALPHLNEVIVTSETEAAYPRMGGHRSLARAFAMLGRSDAAREELRACQRVALSDAPETLRRVGAVALAEHLRDGERDGGELLIARSDIEKAWRHCFGAQPFDEVLKLWIY